MKFTLFALALVLCGCTEVQHIRTIQRFESSQSKILDYQSTDEGIYVLRRTAVRTAHEVYSVDGELIRQFYTDRPVTRVLAVNNQIYFVEEISPARGVVWKAVTGGDPVIISEPGNWTDLVTNASGDLLAFESLFLSQDVAPSAVRVNNLTRGTIAFEDQFSYHYPFSGKQLFLLSPIDRKIRLVEGTGVREIGAVNSIAHPPHLSHDGNYLAWFGPNELGSSLFVADTRGRASVFVTPLSDRPMTWLGDDLAVAQQDAGTAKWRLTLYDIPTGLIQGTLAIPDNVTPRGMLGSKNGRYLGLSTDYGSMLIRMDDRSIQEFFNVPLSSWRFSDDGKKLYLIEQDRLQLVELQ